MYEYDIVQNLPLLIDDHVHRHGGVRAARVIVTVAPEGGAQEQLLQEYFD